MSRWIDADALKENFTCDGEEWINNIIDDAPSIDIVKCGECRWYNCKACFRDESTQNHRNADDFCSYGEVRND